MKNTFNLLNQNLSHSKSIILIISILTFISCSVNSNLKEALVLSKENKSELEKAIKHYSQNPQDHLKYKAALFLIENMKDYYFKEYVLEDEYIQTIDSICQVQYFEINNFMSAVDSISRSLNKNILRRKCQIKKDLEYVTAEQLIRHIDLCFEALEYPWCKNLDFSDFCEYVLPYRLGEEKPENWIGTYRDSMKTTIDFFIKANMSDSSICNYLLQKSVNKDFFYATIIPDLPPSSLLYTRLGVGNCKELQAVTIYSLRALGIPIAIDFTPQWAKRSLGHEWCTFIGANSQIPFLFHDQAPFGTHISSIQHKDGLAKVYRKMYSEQTGTLSSLHPKEKIPPIFENKHLKDVSELYFKPINITIDLSQSPPTPKEYAYLSVFNNQEWVPVDWGRIKKNKVKFKKINSGNVYLVTYYHQGKTYPASNPFIIKNDGGMKMLNPNKDTYTSICLKRKYPDKENVYELAKARTLGGKFQIMTNINSKFTDVYTIKEFPTTLAPTSVVFQTPIEAIALRYVSAPNSNVYLAELEIYNDQNKQIDGDIIGTNGSWYNNGCDKYKVFDHNMLTYFDAPIASDGWVGLQFKKKEKIKRIVYTPYNDDNGINKNELYELFYFDGKWISLGKKYGDSSYVMKYDKVPGNALLLLKNKTKGTEERIFTQENGIHQWW